MLAQAVVVVVVLLALKQIADLVGFGGEPADSLDFGALKTLLAKSDADVVLIDVREKSEFATGRIPGAVNIPFLGASGSLGLEPAEFEKRLGFPKPKPEQTLVFYCRSGTRSSAAARAASKHGYKHRFQYPGSYMEWASKGAPTEK